MARTALSPQTITRSGLTASFAAANGSGGHSFNNSGREILHVKSGGTGCTVTIQTPGTVDGLAVAERTVTLGTNTEKEIGPFPPQDYNQPGTSDVYIDFDSVTSITVAVKRL